MQPVVIQQTSAALGGSSSTYNRDKFSSKAANILASLQIFLGLVCFVLNVVGIILTPKSINIMLGMDNLFNVGHGIWGGIFFIVTGSIGAGAAFNRKKCLVISYMVLCIISAGLIVPAMVAVDSKVIDIYGTLYNRYRRYRSYMSYTTTNNIIELILGLHYGLLSCALAELALSVCAAAFCCRAACCGASQEQQQQVFYMQPQQASQQIIMIPAGGNTGQQYMIQPPTTQQYVAQPQGGFIQPNSNQQYVAQPQGGFIQPNSTQQYVVQQQGGIYQPTAAPQYVLQSPGGIVQPTASQQYVVQPQGGVVAAAPPPYIAQPTTVMQPGQTHPTQTQIPQLQGTVNEGHVPDEERKET